MKKPSPGFYLIKRNGAILRYDLRGYPSPLPPDKMREVHEYYANGIRERAESAAKLADAISNATVPKP